ncbi:uncharacterized protein JCM6883_005743 [Sporobolomyces salmoneus]|uniref:uncharacterized protein n=1 Tax=Sporobolomyces salmoneus TaxID=183962 RepID=UPI0031813E1E
MQRTLLRTLTGRRTFSTSACWCQSSTSSSTPYSLPQDAFSTSSSDSPSSSSSSSYSRSRSPLSSIPASSTSSSSTPVRRSRQKQFLTDSEAQAFADLLGEILPKSKASTPSTSSSSSGSSGGGVFDLFGTLTPSTSSSGTKDGVSQIQTALQKKLSKSSRSSPSSSLLTYDAPSQSRELTPSELLELDTLKETMSSFPSPQSLFHWSLSSIFGLPSTTSSLFIDTSLLRIAVPSSLYPPLLQHLFHLLRDTHSSPHLALRIFSLASSNAHSYILGCTSRLYLSVLETRWTLSEGDLESVLEGFEELQSRGVRITSTDQEGFKSLVSSIGESIQLDRERTELHVRQLEESGHFGGRLDEREREREISRRRFYGDLKPWIRMERILEDHLERSDEIAKEKSMERFKVEERQRELRERIEYENRVDEDGERDFGSREEDSLSNENDRTYSLNGEEEPDSFGGKPSLFSHRHSPSHFNSNSNSLSSPRTHLHPSSRRSNLSPLSNVPRSSSSFDRERERKFDPYVSGGGNSGRSVSWADQDLLRGLPKRPSYANPYKIRRRSLTKEEKKGRDTKHPMLFWKQ